MASSNDRPEAGIAYQIPRNSLALLMVSQLAVIAPLAVYISPWIVGVCLFCGYWRTQVHRGRWGYPGSGIKTFLVVAAVLGIILSGYGSFSLEAAASLLVLAFALKLLEMHNRRDAYLVIYLSYFLIATAFLFDQSMALAAYEVLAAVIITAAMVGMNQLHSRVRPLASMRVAASLILQALPLTLVLFMLFPRVAPLWSIPVPSASSTGISDRMRPGDVANLTQSDEIAFRAVFKGAVPAARDLYWRGLVFSEFEDGTWSVGETLPPIADPVASVDAVEYEVFLQPTQSKWLFALDTPVAFGDRIQLLRDYRLVNPEPVLSVKRYRVRSVPDYMMDPVLSADLRERETRLEDADDNPRLRAYAAQLYARTGTPRAMIDAMLKQIEQEDYHYTLSPPALTDRVKDTIDQFWFDTRAGFCTHYAGAMVYALRSVGIPARMVAGYQGGELNPVTGHMVVRQYEAHAWIEVWLGGQGWTRFDPTAAVAPARVERGLSAALSSADRAELSFMTSARFGSGIGDLMQWVDSLEHRWNLWVVGYDADTQADVLKDLLGAVTPTRIGIALLVGGGLSVLIVTAGVFLRRRPRSRHPVERMLQRFANGMASRGWRREPGEPPAAYITRLATAAGMDGSAIAARVQQLLYDPDAQRSDAAERRQLRRELRKLRFRLAFTPQGKAS